MATTPTTPTIPTVTNQEVQDFSDHCVYIRSVYLWMLRLFRDSDDAECALMKATAPLFFDDLFMVFREFMVIAVCRITDPAKMGRNENFTVEMFVNSFSSDAATFKQLDELHQRMKPFVEKIRPARNKLGAHTDRATVASGELLGAASWGEWGSFGQVCRILSGF